MSASVYEAFNNPGWAWLKEPPSDPHARWAIAMDVIPIRPGQMVYLEEGYELSLDDPSDDTGGIDGY